ncbi:ATP-dependent zinc metalloprotease FtsH [Gossypium australe]|uniref:ATP-dependent zinc metalloprotease FtsH n=2 Tax=Gossypium australe TaxID=47621 RepID=A0A5B6VXY8_9ROSI|nr:ATP-dependent zinc metalloprotease FtsH [Gossypium australe]
MSSRGRGRGRMTASEPVGSGYGSESEVPPAVDVEEQDPISEEDTVSQAMLRVLQQVARASRGNGARKSVSERFRSNGAEVFRGVSGTAPNGAEYWLEGVERIMDDLDCAPEEKLKGAVSLLRDEAYRWWLTVKQGVPADRLDWDYFKEKFEGKYVGASYLDAQRKAFLNLVQGNKSIAEYEAEFVRLSQYAKGIVVTDYERCVRFEDGLRDELRVLIAPQRERDFTVLVEKARIAEEVKRTVSENRGKNRNENKRSGGWSASFEDAQKRPRVGNTVHTPVPVAENQNCLCARYGRPHTGKCWGNSKTCFRCGSKAHLVKNCPRSTRGHGSSHGGNGSSQNQPRSQSGQGKVPIPKFKKRAVSAVRD